MLLMAAPPVDGTVAEMPIVHVYAPAARPVGFTEIVNEPGVVPVAVPPIVAHVQPVLPATAV